jgi:hypothetical protein
MLAAIHFNKNKEAEQARDRGNTFWQNNLYNFLGLIYEFRCYSKAMGDYRTKTRKGPRADEWKLTLVVESMQRASNFVPDHAAGDHDLDEVDVIDAQLAEILVFDSDDEEIDD